MTNDPDPYYVEGTPEQEQFENRKFKLEEIREIEAWAAEVLKKADDSPIQTSSWEIHGALITFQLCASEEGALDIYQGRARKAIELNPKNWHACHFIAKQSNTRNEESVELLSRAKQAVDELRHGNKAWMKDHANTSLLARITLDLGDRLWDLGQDYQLAARTHRESLKYDYVHFVNYTDVLNRYQKREAWAEFIAFIETLNDTSETWVAYFDELVNQFVVNIITVRGSDMFAQAAIATNRWDVIEAFFTLAINIGIQKETHDLIFLLRDNFAKTLAYSNSEEFEDRVIAIQETALEHVKLHRTDSLSRPMIDAMANSLAQTYLDKAFQPNVSLEKVDQYGTLIANLLPDIGDLDISMNNGAICSLIRYHHKRQSNSDLAKECVQIIVRTGLELLSDADEENDNFAYLLLARLLTVVGDVKNTRITWTLRNMAQYVAQLKWQNWMTAGQISANGETSANGNTNGSINGAVDDSKAKPISRSTTTDTTSSSDEPVKPDPMVICDGCDKEWTFTDVPLYTCSDCLGQVQLCKECYGLLTRGELKKTGLACKQAHEKAFIEVPSWDPSLTEGMPRAYVPLPDSKEKTGRWISLDQWKGELRKLYLDGEAGGAVAQTS